MTQAAKRSRLTWSLEVQTERHGDLVVVAPSGRLGTVSSGSFIEIVVDAVASGGRGLVVDLAGVDYVSSAGLLALDALQGRLHVARGELVLCGLTEPVRLALELSGLLPHFAVETTREAALARVAQLSAADS